MSLGTKIKPSDSSRMLSMLQPMKHKTNGKIYYVIGTDYDKDKGTSAFCVKSSKDTKMTIVNLKNLTFVRDKKGEIVHNKDFAPIPALITSGDSNEIIEVFKNNKQEILDRIK